MRSLYQWCQVSERFVIIVAIYLASSTDLITVPSGPIVIDSGHPYSYYLTLSQLPTSPITVTPYSAMFSFNPPSVTFDTSIFASISATTLSFAGYGSKVYYNISGNGAQSIGLSSPFTEFYAFFGLFLFNEF